MKGLYNLIIKIKSEKDIPYSTSSNTGGSSGTYTSNKDK
jgi:hypothetical protein